jgi:hypothetical protein
VTAETKVVRVLPLIQWGLKSFPLEFAHIFPLLLRRELVAFETADPGLGMLMVQKIGAFPAFDIWLYDMAARAGFRVLLV